MIGEEFLCTLKSSCKLVFILAMPHPQAAMMSQLPSNRQQTMVGPTPPIYIIPQPQVASGIPPAPSVAAAFQPTQFGMYSQQLHTFCLHCFTEHQK